MQYTTINISRKRLSIAAAFAALLVLLLLNFTSTGVVRYGGEDEEGSGIGGTGRMLSPGGSGFGGTGRTATGGSGFGGTGFKPFLGVTENREVEILRSPAGQHEALTESLDLQIEARKPVMVAPVTSPIAVTDERFAGNDSGPINITQSIQVAVTNNAVALQQLRDFLEAEAARTAAADLPGAVNADSPVSGESGPDKLTWKAVAGYLAANMPPEKDDADLALQLNNAGFETLQSETEPARLNRPERIQRPVLPPIQRPRPIQRAAILPPRVQPFRL